MICFMPYPDFIQTAQCLDRQRLGKQRLEALHILKASLGYVKPYKSYASIRQWKGYLKALCHYGIIICMEWVERGYIDNQEPIFKIIDHQDLRYDELIMPPWLGNEQYHSNQRARLLDKNFEWYKQFGWEEEPTSEYWFPEELYQK